MNTYQPGDRVRILDGSYTGTVQRVDDRYVHVVWDDCPISYDGVTSDGQPPAVPALAGELEAVVNGSPGVASTKAATGVDAQAQS